PRRGRHRRPGCRRLCQRRHARGVPTNDLGGTLDVPQGRTARGGLALNEAPSWRRDATRGTLMRETVLVAGGSGFIGSHLCEALLRTGNDVVCIDNLSTG